MLPAKIFVGQIINGGGHPKKELWKGPLVLWLNTEVHMERDFASSGRNKLSGILQGWEMNL